MDSQSKGNTRDIEPIKGFQSRIFCKSLYDPELTKTEVRAGRCRSLRCHPGRRPGSQRWPSRRQVVRGQQLRHHP